MKLKMIVAAVAATASASAFAAGSMNDQVQNGGGIVNVRTDASYSQQVLNNQQVTGSVLDILNARKSGDLAPNAIYIGGKGEIYAQYKNTSGSPTTNPRNNSSSEVKMPYADLAFTSTIGDWVTGFADVQVTNAASSNVTLPNAYFIVGNLAKSPFYAFGGKKVVEFGKFDSVTNFMPTLTRAYFMAYGGQVGAGFSSNGLDVVATLMNGRGESMMNSQASSAQQLNNFALNASYNGKAGNLGYYAGAGYVNATGFSEDALGANNKMVGALDFNAGVTVQGLAVNGEFLVTTSGVSSNNVTSVGFAGATTGGANSRMYDSTGYTAFGFNALPLDMLVNFDSGSTVKAWSLDSSYTMPVAGKDMVPYVSYSQVAQNSDNNLYQFEVGTRYNVVDTVWIGGSYNYMSGKSAGTSVGKFNTVMLDATVYF
ncbi:LbtU family siderophore porin [Cysteiniphilum sp. QT6929]|uniref:LbtU family siderophore porin n=1 Tax=Cysteiniphilum sp. QT6929 TaxID=2975055 RepID=UPI0024B34111|nr:LbtU family siderophore porin [Cysteiniphilum sp. QT6929]WHN64555.1 LbtU family siderophore porin [Cysteiniphilum sp. QT6929]